MVFIEKQNSSRGRPHSTTYFDAILEKVQDFWKVKQFLILDKTLFPV